jgi:hypothetical protein
VASWLAELAAGLTLLFLVSFAAALAVTLTTNQALFAMGAPPAAWRWVLSVPTLLAVVTAVMVAAMIAVWHARERSVAGRLYFTLLTIAVLVATADLLSRADAVLPATDAAGAVSTRAPNGTLPGARANTTRGRRSPR